MAEGKTWLREGFTQSRMTLMIMRKPEFEVVLQSAKTAFKLKFLDVVWLPSSLLVRGGWWLLVAHDRGEMEAAEEKASQISKKRTKDKTFRKNRNMI